ncbi:MAG TPA: hypothetical protein VFZ38_10735 [Vicinamibacterales bacterium]
MDEEQQRASQLTRESLAMQLGNLMLANIEQGAILQAMREQMLKRAQADAKEREGFGLPK